MALVVPLAAVLALRVPQQNRRHGVGGESAHDHVAVLRLEPGSGTLHGIGELPLSVETQLPERVDKVGALELPDLPIGALIELAEQLERRRRTPR